MWRHLPIKGLNVCLLQRSANGGQINFLDAGEKKSLLLPERSGYRNMGHDYKLNYH